MTARNGDGAAKNPTADSDARLGYTLAEIMVGILIFGILLMVAVPNYAKARERARNREASAQLELLASAIRRLAWDTGRWPLKQRRDLAADYEVWDLSVGSAGLLRTDGGYSSWQGPYVNAIPLDPWGSQYFFDPDYRVGNANKVVVGSFGPNRQGKNLYDSDDLYIVID